MNSLITGLIIAGVAVVFVNVLLFGFLGISVKSVPIGSLFLLQGVIAVFTLFIYQITKKGR